MVIGVYIGNQFGSERAAEDMICFPLGRFLRGDELSVEATTQAPDNAPEPAAPLGATPS